MRARKGWNDWSTFEPAARKVIEQHLQDLSRVPTAAELIQAGQRWICDAAYAHHGGYVTILQRMGFVPSRHRRRWRWSSWEDFAQAARPVLADYLERDGFIPTEIQLEADRQSWLPSAAARHFGGFPAAVRRLGFSYVRIRRTMQNWEVFVQRARPILERYQSRTGYSPSTVDLRADGYQWIAATAIRYHGGYPASLERMGMPKVAWRMSNWHKFVSRAKPIIQRYQQQLGYPPTSTQLSQAGHGWIVRAAGVHFGGYIATLHRLGIGPPGPPNFKDWEYFQARAKPMIGQVRDQLGRLPSGAYLQRHGLGWIPRATQEHHGGYVLALRQMGFASVCHPNKGSGLADPAVFASQFRPAVQAVIKKIGHVPSARAMERAGYRSVVVASRRHHGGYLVNLVRAGFTLRPNQRVSARVDWHSLTEQLRALKKWYPAEINAGFLPAYQLVIRDIPSLARYWSGRGITWSGVAERLGLLSAKVANPQRRYVAAVAEALSFFEANGRWPKVAECSPRLCAIRFHHQTTWLEVLSRQDLHPKLLQQLTQRWQAHLVWIRRQRPELEAKRRRLTNRLVIELNGHVPSPRSS